MYCLAMYITYDGLIMMAPQLVYLIGLRLLLILFVFFLSFKQPKGAQPATYGHLPTLVDLLHDCNEGENRRLSWSPEPETYGSRGTMGDELPPVYGSDEVSSTGPRYFELGALWLQPPFGKPPNVYQNVPTTLH